MKRKQKIKNYALKLKKAKKYLQKQDQILVAHVLNATGNLEICKKSFSSYYGTTQGLDGEVVSTLDFRSEG